MGTQPLFQARHVVGDGPANIIEYLESGEPMMVATVHATHYLSLLAAAPDLLAALQAWTEYAVNRDVPFALIAQTRAAIANATNRNG